MSNSIALSVIFPLFNAVEDIEGVFDAIGNQIDVDKQTIEIIIIDDGSTDGTLQKVNEHKNLFTDFFDFRVIKHQKNQGLAQTRYDAATEAKGHYITFVDKKTRPDNDYFFNLLNKKRSVVIGNVYMDKTRSLWDRSLAQFRKKLYFPYFNHPFKDIELDYEAYKNFKNKGGGGAMLVEKELFLAVAENLNKGRDVNDDSMLIEGLAKKVPILKTYSAKAKYLNRTGTKDNLMHIYNRGPKFVDYYIHPGTRFFPYLVACIGLLVSTPAIIWVFPGAATLGLGILIVFWLGLGIYLSDEVRDFFAFVVVTPVAIIGFIGGIFKGIFMKIIGKY